VIEYGYHERLIDPFMADEQTGEQWPDNRVQEDAPFRAGRELPLLDGLFHDGPDLLVARRIDALQKFLAQDWIVLDGRQQAGYDDPVFAGQKTSYLEHIFLQALQGRSFRPKDKLMVCLEKKSVEQ
jgi:hypothetical protein